MPAKRLRKLDAVNRNDISGVRQKCHGELLEAAIVIAIVIAISLLDGRFTRLASIIKARVAFSSLILFHLQANNKKQQSISTAKNLNTLQLLLFNHTSTAIMSDNSNNKPSTLQSYVDSATGAVQNAFGNLTGNTGDQAKGEVRQDKAQAEYDASQAAVKLPGGTISSTGAFAKDDPNRTEGSWNQTLGSAKETLGGLIGNEVCSLHTAGTLSEL